jgi:hypothetical protein
MSKYLYILIMMAGLFACSKADDQVIGEKSDQAFIQDVVVTDTLQNDVSLKKVVPVVVPDPVTNVEKLDKPGTPLEITVTLKPNVDITKLNVRFTLSSQSKYAKVTPALGHIKDYTGPVEYTVTSQSGKRVSVYRLVIKGS